VAADVESTPPEQWRSRIVGTGTEDPSQLLANPRNWRIHPKYQQDALQNVMDRVGWVQTVLVNTTTGHLIDGHMRVGQAISKGEREVPVTYVELTEEEERMVLATLDPIGDLAAVDEGALKGLVGDLEGELDEALQSVLQKISPAVSAPAPTGGSDSPPASATQEQIDRERDRLESRFEDTQRHRMIDVDCPHCGLGFGINLDEFDDPRYKG
jgi:hypothetical protein